MTQREKDFTIGFGNPNNPDDRAVYHVWVNGYIWEHGTTAEHNDDRPDVFEVLGSVSGGWDKYDVRGWVGAINLDGGAQVTIGGENVGRKGALDYRPQRFRGGGNGDTDNGVPTPDAPQNDAGGVWNPDSTSERALVPTYGCVDRPLLTTNDRAVTIGRGEDVGTVQEFANGIPRIVEHGRLGQLAKGVHANEPGNSVNIYPSISLASTGKVKIVGDKRNPDEYVLDANQINIQALDGTAQDIAFEGVTIRGTIQNRVGNVELDHCIVSSGERWGNDPVAIDTYDGMIQILDTHIESDHAAFNLVEDATISLNSGCSIDADGPVCTSGQAGGLLAIGGDIDVECNGAITQGWEPAGIRVIDTHGALDGLENGPAGIRLG